jgi:predicted GH43/DUF377 family glycosyl hydrolase
MHICYINDGFLHLGACCFNGCLIKTHDGNYQFYYRKNKTIPEWFDSKVYLVTFPPDFIETSKHTFFINDRYNYVIPEPTLIIEHGEDPRVINLDKNRKLISYAVIETIENKKCDIHARIIGGKSNSEIFTFPKNNALKAREKNWTFFLHEGNILFMYSVMPYFSIYDMNENLIVSCEWYHPLANDLELRGGASPIRVGDEYWVIVHSKTYRIFVITFSVHDLMPRRVSKRPLIPHGDKPRIHFPCGAILEDDGSIIISLGIDDYMSGLLHTSVTEINSVLIDK